MLVQKIKVLVVDDSAIVRKILSETIDAESDMEVIGTAPDPFVARDKILLLKPDVLTLDIEMPRMDGLTFLKKLMQFHPMPVIMISSLARSSCETSLEALRHGAVEVMAKPGGPYSIGDLKEALPAKLRAAFRSRVSAVPPKPSVGAPVAAAPPANTPVSAPSFDQNGIVAIGASTGGVEAIHEVMMNLPKNLPGVVIAQHIPQHFSTAFANRLNQSCGLEVREAVAGDVLRPGLALLAPGDYHMLVRRTGSRYTIELQQGPKVCYQRPAVDVLFTSVACAAKQNAVGVLLTGMGSDGAQGLLKMRQAGAVTIAQNEASCVVYGMPREAVKLGAAMHVVPLSSISGVIVREASRLKGNA